MAFNFKTPEQVADEYLLHLSSLKPEANVDQSEDNDWWIRSRVVGGVVSGLYADQALAANDAFPQRARHEALGRHLDTYFDDTFKPAQIATGYVRFGGVVGSPIPVGVQATYEPNGNTYEVTEAGVIGAAGTGIALTESISAGQDQNLLEGAALTVSNPPAGIDLDAVVYEGDIRDGRNAESDEEAAARILARIRAPIRGGTVDDYKQWAAEGSASVTDANVLRWYAGFGTIGVVIAAGTSDIDEAVDNNVPVVFTPSQTVIDTVQAYLETKRPVNDCVEVFGVQELPIDVSVRVRFVQGDASTILSGQTLTQGELVQREITRGIYKTPVGGFKLGASGYVVASHLEEVLDDRLSASPHTEGRTLQIILDRQVEDLSASGVNLLILGTQAAIPGTITVTEF